MKVEKARILSSILGSGFRNGPETLHTCPKCNHHKKKLSINVEKDVFKCWVCDFSGNKLSYLVKRYGTEEQVYQWGQASGIDLSSLDQYEDLFSSAKEAITPEKLHLPKNFTTLTSFDAMAKAPLNYLYSRGLTRSDILLWKIGYVRTGQHADRIVIPSFDKSGNLNYYVSRAYKKSLYPKYKNPNVSKDIIFNDLMIDWSRPVTLVEGVFDAMKATNAIPLLGSTLREGGKLFSKIVKNRPLIYIALDSDAYDKSLGIFKMLSKHDISTKLVTLSDNRDLGDISKEEANKLYNKATDINSDNYLLYEIQKI